MEYCLNWQEHRSIILVSAILSVVLFSFVQIFGITSSVVDGYWPYADAMYHGVVPYTQDIWFYESGEPLLKGWEYPPATYLFMFIPRLFSWDPMSYQAAFIIFVDLFFLLGLCTAIRLSNAIGVNPEKVILAYAAVCLFMAEFILDRIDLFPMVLVFVSLALLIRNKIEGAFAILALATLVKLYPGLLFVPFLVYVSYIHGSKRAINAVAAFFLVVLGGFCVVLAIGADPLKFLSYHLSRGLEVESFAASIFSIINLFSDLGIQVEYSSGSDNLVGNLPDSLASVLIYVVALAELILYFAYWHMCRKHPGFRGYLGLSVVSFVSIWIFVMFYTVFSGQYMIWFISVIVPMLFLFKDEAVSGKIFKVFILTEVLTQLDFLINFGMRGVGDQLSAIGVIVIFIRNLLMIYLLFSVGIGCRASCMGCEQCTLAQH